MKWCYLPAQPLKCMDCLQEPLRQISMNCALQCREESQCHTIWYHNMFLCCSLTCLRFSGKMHLYLNTPSKYTLKGRYCSSQKRMKTNTKCKWEGSKSSHCSLRFFYSQAEEKNASKHIPHKEIASSSLLLVSS